MGAMSILIGHSHEGAFARGRRGSLFRGQVRARTVIHL